MFINVSNCITYLHLTQSIIRIKGLSCELLPIGHFEIEKGHGPPSCTFDMLIRVDMRVRGCHQLVVARADPGIEQYWVARLVRDDNMIVCNTRQ